MSSEIVKSIPTKIVHLGFGAFYRAHQAVYSHEAMDAKDPWGTCVVSLFSGQPMISALTEQNYQYSVIAKGDGGANITKIQSISNALHPMIHGKDVILDTMASIDTHIISLTITEKGYCIEPHSRQLDTSDPLILHDLAKPSAPRSAIGYIVESLTRRFERNLGGVTVLSCDNIPNNGEAVQNAVTQFAELISPEFALWIDREVTFPSSMVDRITPAVTNETQQEIDRIVGEHDSCGIITEPFSQWVIEDNFRYGRPTWEIAGAQFVEDVTPYEDMKLRMLNGAHSFIAYLGYLAGYKTVAETIQDKDFEIAVRRLMTSQAQTLQMPQHELDVYKESLIERFRNTQLKHKTWQIAMDGSQKLPQRILRPMELRLQADQDCDDYYLAIAAWIRYVGGVDDNGERFEVKDPKSAQFDTIYKSTQPNNLVEQFIQVEDVFGAQLIQNDTAVARIKNAYESIVQHGAKNTLKRFNVS
ncbi:mannitol dehydrogenase family protein [Vibrio penaeicida]|uniref:Oxidoreductase n=1 Tax=Vibrio penaeicida TaxID=104609 RepID=A0AAV5NT45_9VIBR|nr:mannitol dehydrogenase family protein [Vibrio penaeicida]RTZ21785.1 mannitol dehydrogenase family protein [Vibrio penaeicida]GLQ73719.1 oxidoreductase [Vibrio penaeicida]